MARILSISIEDEPVEYEQIGTRIHALHGLGIDLRYVRGFTVLDDGAGFPDDFGETLANLLAAELAVSLMQNQSLRDTYLNMYAERLGQCRFNGAVERYILPEEASTWLNAHGGLLPTEVDPRLRGVSGY